MTAVTIALNLLFFFSLLFYDYLLTPQMVDESIFNDFFLCCSPDEFFRRITERKKHAVNRLGRSIAARFLFAPLHRDSLCASAQNGDRSLIYAFNLCGLKQV